MNLQAQASQNMVHLHGLGKVQVVLCYNINACRFPLFLDRISDTKSAGFYFGAEMEDLGIGIYKIILASYPRKRVLYIGQSKYLRERFIHHKADLKVKRHANSHLQHIYDKHGFAGMSFEIVCNCRISELDALEQFYIDELKPECNIIRDIKNWNERYAELDNIVLLDLDIIGLELDWRPQRWHKWVYGCGRR